jgi:hypothetical protein
MKKPVCWRIFETDMYLLFIHRPQFLWFVESGGGGSNMVAMVACMGTLDP